MELLRKYNLNVDLFVKENLDVIEIECMSGIFLYFKDIEGLVG